MSHSSSATVSLSTTQPLSDILPWGSPLSVVHSTSTNEDATTQYKTHNRTLLITDSTSADGRFILHTLALQFLSSRYNIPNNDSTAAMEGAVLWITLSPVSERQVVMALRKGMQHNLSGGGGGNAAGAAVGSTNVGNPSSSSTSGRIHVVSVPLEVADAALQDEEKQPDFSHETYLKQLHQRIVHWLNHRELLSPSQLEQQQHQTQQQLPDKSSSMGPNLVIIDNGTMLSTMFGDILTNAFISSVRATLKNHSRKSSTAAAAADVAAMGGVNAPSTTVNTTNLLTIRTSSPDDGGLYQLSDEITS
ncbi:hypothetical protein QTG54_010230 [Skeletonema marinoi]|uniref:Uncharacterized protein n=1 Tax=Skeletonema marinoi TaxID=267567 RepID=A0AAD9DAH1_9STRA|nr:hypothetical protein QTG54_010230 [Skeletonema marinoi]